MACRESRYVWRVDVGRRTGRSTMTFSKQNSRALPCLIICEQPPSVGGSARRQKVLEDRSVARSVRLMTNTSSAGSVPARFSPPICRVAAVIAVYFPRKIPPWTALFLATSTHWDHCACRVPAASCTPLIGAPLILPDFVLSDLVIAATTQSPDLSIEFGGNASAL